MKYIKVASRTTMEMAFPAIGHTPAKLEASPAAKSYHHQNLQSRSINKSQRFNKFVSQSLHKFCTNSRCDHFRQGAEHLLLGLWSPINFYELPGPGCTSDLNK